MTNTLRKQLIEAARQKSHDDDPSHDFNHILRVLKNAEFIAEREGGDVDVLVPAALFHDAINYPKNDPRARQAPEESAEYAANVLRDIDNYPSKKIPDVVDAIAKCSFTNGILPTLLESKILQDADGLESTGAISIMRTFSSGGLMRRPFFHPEDPLCARRDATMIVGSLDLFYKRLLQIKDRLHTETAQKMAVRRHQFLLDFLDEVRYELGQ